MAFEERIRRTLFEKYPEIVSDNIQPLPVKVKPMRINTGNNLPVYSPCRPLRGKKLREVKAELRKWIKFDIIESLTEPCRWASPIHCVRKGDGTWRICGDFRRLNTVTEKENIPLPKLDEFSEMVAGCTIFSKCDLTKAYLQLSVAKEARHKTAINTPIGIFKFKRMPFGLLNSAQKFMQAIRQVLQGLPGIFAYMDDILICSHSEEENLKHLGGLFQRLKEYGFVLNPDKCSFAKESMQFLGHNVDKRGLSIPESKKKAIGDYKRPSTAQELERFLGLFAFIHRFIPRGSTLTAELNKLRQLPPAKFRNSWSKIHDEAFEDIKKAVLCSGLLYHPLPDTKMELWTDASDVAAGAVLV